MIEAIAHSLLALLHLLFGVALWQTVLAGIGRFVLLLLTLGRYPRGAAVARDENRLGLMGVLVLVVVWSVIAIHNNLRPG